MTVLGRPRGAAPGHTAERGRVGQRHQLVGSECCVRVRAGTESGRGRRCEWPGGGSRQHAVLGQPRGAAVRRVPAQPSVRYSVANASEPWVAVPDIDLYGEPTRLPAKRRRGLPLVPDSVLDELAGELVLSRGSVADHATLPMAGASDTLLASHSRRERGRTPQPARSARRWPGCYSSPVSLVMAPPCWRAGIRRLGGCGPAGKQGSGRASCPSGGGKKGNFPGANSAALERIAKRFVITGGGFPPRTATVPARHVRAGPLPLGNAFSGPPPAPGLARSL